MPHPVSLSLLADVLAKLLEERVTIRPLGRILQSLMHHVPQETDPAVLAENVRLDIRREMLAAWGGEGILPVFLVSASVEDDVRLGIRRSETGTWIHMHPETLDELHRRARELAEPLEGRLVLVASMDVRRFLYKILSPAVPDVRVLSYPELEGHPAIQPVGEF
jgi:type III secretion protein V